MTPTGYRPPGPEGRPACTTTNGAPTMRLDSTTFSIGLALSHDLRVDDQGARTVTHEHVADVAAETQARVATVRAVARALHIAIAPKGATTRRPV